MLDEKKFTENLITAWNNGFDSSAVSTKKVSVFFRFLREEGKCGINVSSKTNKVPLELESALLKEGFHKFRKTYNLLLREIDGVGKISSLVDLAKKILYDLFANKEKEKLEYKNYSSPPSETRILLSDSISMTEEERWQAYYAEVKKRLASITGNPAFLS